MHLLRIFVLLSFVTLGCSMSTDTEEPSTAAVPAVTTAAGGVVPSGPAQTVDSGVTGATGPQQSAGPGVTGATGPQQSAGPGATQGSVTGSTGPQQSAGPGASTPAPLEATTSPSDRSRTSLALTFAATVLALSAKVLF